MPLYNNQPNYKGKTACNTMHWYRSILDSVTTGRRSNVSLLPAAVRSSDDDSERRTNASKWNECRKRGISNKPPFHIRGEEPILAETQRRATMILPREDIIASFYQQLESSLLLLLLSINCIPINYYLIDTLNVPKTIIPFSFCPYY